MRGEVSKGPQSWPEFLDRFAQIAREETERGKKWEDKPVPEASLQIDKGIKTSGGGQRGPYKPEELGDPTIEELHELMNKQEFIKQWRRELIRFYVEKENTGVTIEELQQNPEYRIITERGSFPTYALLIGINMQLKKYGFIFLPIREDNKKSTWEKRFRIYKLKS